MDPEVALKIGVLAEDHLSGATALAQQAAEAFVLAAELSRAPGVAQFMADMAEVGHVLMAAQPAMASFFTLANTVLQAAERAPLEAKRAAVQATARGFAAQVARRGAKLAEACLPLIPENASVITLSASSAVEGALRRAHDAGRLARVICSESRPLNEGVGLAERLGAVGIPVFLTTDAALPSLVRQASLVLVGADTVAPLGVVNKAGTYPLALTARRAGIPVVALAGSEKFLPPGIAEAATLTGEERPPDEVLAPVPVGITVINRAFDLTPLDLITQAVTERGTLGAAEVEVVCQSIAVHPLLMT